MGRFGRAQEEIRAFAEGTAGKLLLVSDGSGSAALAPASILPRTVFAVLEGDALPLFAMPDAGAVIAAGGQTVLACARYFAELMGVPCLLLPTDARFRDVYGSAGEVTLDGEAHLVPLKRGDVVWDTELLKPSLPHAYARLVLIGLGLFERRALARLGEGVYGEAEEGAYAALQTLTVDENTVIQTSAALSQMEADGLKMGEGETLAAQTGDEFSAYRTLLALYEAFFRYGTPQRLPVDYRGRAARAGVPYASLKIPTFERLQRRAELLGQWRLLCLQELMAEKRQLPVHERNLRALGGRISNNLLWPNTLPERCPNGLCAVIRDFGLMEDQV